MKDKTDEFISVYNTKITSDQELKQAEQKQNQAEQELNDKIEELKGNLSIQAKVRDGIEQKKQVIKDRKDERKDDLLIKQTEIQAYDDMIKYIDENLGPDGIGGRGKKYRRSKKKRSHKISKRRRKKSMRKKKTRRR